VRRITNAVWVACGLVAGLTVVDSATADAIQHGSPPTTAPPASTTTTEPTTEPSPSDPSAGEAPEEVPQTPVAVPPPEGPEVVDPLAPVLAELSKVSEAELSRSAAQARLARNRLSSASATLMADIAGLDARMAQLSRDQTDAVARLEKARGELTRRAVGGYMGSQVTPLNDLLSATSVTDLTRRFELLRAVIEADRRRIAENDRARRAVGAALAAVVDTLQAKRAELAATTAELDAAEMAVSITDRQLRSVRAGSSVAGFVFPVAGPNSFVDTFGAPRMFGTAYAHLHQGTDIFAAAGTPVVAVERGVLIRVGTDVLGGIKLWLVGASGTRYYYAHMQGFAPGVVENKVVRAGEVVGYVGSSGNAVGTSAHVHFEVHPDGGGAVNPYPLLRLVDEAQRRVAGSPQRTTGSPS